MAALTLLTGQVSLSFTAQLLVYPHLFPPVKVIVPSQPPKSIGSLEGHFLAASLYHRMITYFRNDWRGRVDETAIIRLGFLRPLEKLRDQVRPDSSSARSSIISFGPEPPRKEGVAKRTDGEMRFHGRLTFNSGRIRIPQEAHSYLADGLDCWPALLDHPSLKCQEPSIATPRPIWGN